MTEKPRGLSEVTLGVLLCVLACAVPAAAQGVFSPAPPSPPAVIPASQTPPNQPAASQPASNPVCVRLESQLASFNQGSADAARADQIKRAQDSIAKQQADLDHTLAQAHKAGCEGQGFFALFSAFSQQCGPITSQIQGMRANLDRSLSDLEQLKSGNSDPNNDQRHALIVQLAQNNCGAQYASAADQSGPGGFLGALFGGTVVNSGGDGAPSGTYHTVCVRTCDGYYFPISYSTVPSRFADDERACQRECPASEVGLYAFRNPGEDMEQAVSTSGQSYTALPNAFRYRKEVTAGCSCRKPGQSWADALKNADDATTLENGDIVVTDQKAKAMSQAPQAALGKSAKAGAVQPDPVATASTPAPTTTETDPGKRTVRTVGPPFLSSSALQASQPQASSH
jgi:hypothetical protein